MEIKILHEPIEEEEVRALARAWHQTLVKGVADVEREIIALGGEWHMDANVRLIEESSSQENLWGFNVYPDKKGTDALEFFSLINIRPAQGNREMELKDEGLREKIRTIVSTYIPFLEV